MKKLVTTIVAACALLFTGCTITDPNTGEKVFSEARTRAAVDPAIGLISMGVMVASQADPNTQSAFQIGLSVIEGALAEGVIDKEEIIRRLAEIDIDGVTPEMSRLIVRRIVGTTLNWYGILEDEALTPWLNDPQVSSKVALIILEAIRDGIQDGLPSSG